MIDIVKADGQGEQAVIAAMRARAAQNNAAMDQAASAILAASTIASGMCPYICMPMGRS